MRANLAWGFTAIVSFQIGGHLPEIFEGVSQPEDVRLALSQV
jgi:hypothetical protein